MTDGGPSIPSDYLQPMAANFQDRCIIFYDQIGCGNSSIPSDMNQYSIQHSVDDLEQLIHHLKLKQFHLYGHSFGGIVAYEFSKRQRDSPNNKTDHADEMPQLLSMTLSSTPSNLRGVSEESQSLMETLRKRSNSDCNISSDYDSREERDHIEDPVSDLFKKTFVCRTTDGTIPQPLQEAFHKKGSVWEGSDVIIDYIAEPRHNSTSKMPRAMLMRGEHDFVSEKYGFHDWKNLINDNHIDYVTLSDCAHYSMLENASLHADVLNKFLNKCDKEDFNSQEVSQ